MTTINPKWLDKDFYGALGLEKDTDQTALKKAYRKLAQKYHPDRNPDDKEAEARFREVTEAYEVLGNPEKRKLYDQVSDDKGSPYANLGFSNGEPFDQVFTNLFNSQEFTGQEGMGFRNVRFPRGGADLKASPVISFHDAIMGTELTFTHEEKTYTCKIPPLTNDGETLTFEGHGLPGVGGAINGDLVVTINVKDHKWFSREDLNLSVTAPVTFTELALGAVIKVPTYPKGVVSVKIPPGTPSGRRFKVKGAGIATGGKTGDLVVTVKVEIPKELSNETLAKVKALTDEPEFSNPRKHFEA